MTDIIRQERLLPYPVARVWRALTDPALVGQWLMPADIQPVVGHPRSGRGAMRDSRLPGVLVGVAGCPARPWGAEPWGQGSGRRWRWRRRRR